MAIVATIRVLNDLLPSGRVADVLVHVYEADGPLVTTGITNSSGEAPFLLDDGEYDIYLYKRGISVLPRQPQRIEVDHTEASNIFGITVHVATMPESTDPHKCRITGQLLGADGSPTQDVKLSLAPVPKILVVGQQAISTGSQLSVRPDSRFQFDFTLLRGVDYDGYFVLGSGLDDSVPGKLDIRVPDAPAIAIADLLFPVPVETEFSQPTLALPVSAVRDVTTSLEVTYSDGSVRTTPPIWGCVILLLSDSTVLDAELVSGTLSILAKQAGTCTITTVRVMGDMAKWLPELPPFTSGSMVVTVS